jgi:hypothetical protein
MSSVALTMCWVLAGHAFVVGSIYLAVHLHSGTPLALVGLSTFQFAAATAIWFGVKLRIGGPYRHTCRVALSVIVLIDLALWVRYGGVRLGHLFELGIPILASCMCFLSYSSALVRTALPGHCDHCGYDLTGAPYPVCPECGRCTSERLNERLDPHRLKLCVVGLTAPDGVADPLASINLGSLEVREEQRVDVEQNPPDFSGRSLEVRDGDQRVWVYQIWNVQADRPSVGIQSGDGARTSLDLLIRLHDIFIAAGYSPDDPEEIALYREILSEGSRPVDTSDAMNESPNVPR